MLDLLPRRAFFSFELPIPYLARPPRVNGDVSKWPQKCLVPPLVELEDQEPLADVYWAWNDGGLHVAFDVPNRSGKPHCDPRHWWKGDGLRLCIDTRDARDIKRATRFCHFFYFLPLGGGPDGSRPVVGTHRMSRAKEPPPAIDVSRISVAAHVDRRGYTLEAAIPGTCLNGWNPADHVRIGIYYKVKDLQLGSQHLSSDDDLGWNADPSTWATGVLVR
jgi:hypothetical protein